VPLAEMVVEQAQGAQPPSAGSFEAPVSPGPRGGVSRGRMSPRQKAAVLLVAVGPEHAAAVFRHLSDEEIEQLTLEVASLRRVTPEEKAQVLAEAQEMLRASDYIQQGGIDYARRLLERAVGPQKAAEIIGHMTASLQVRPFEFARQSDPSQLLSFIQHEHPQTIALLLAHLYPEQASAILGGLEPERQVDVARRLALMDNTSPEIVKEVERVLQAKFARLMTEGVSRAGGIEAVVEVLNHADRSTERRILEALELQDPELAAEIKKRMFVFDDIASLDDRSLQRALREVDMNTDLPLALKAASDEVKAKIFRNISQRAGQLLQEAMEYLGPVRLRDVEDAQQRIVAVVRRLEEEGEIVISRGGGDQIIV
jgi:flagellar motor switch protein FliG